MFTVYFIDSPTPENLSFQYFVEKGSVVDVLPKVLSEIRNSARSGGITITPVATFDFAITANLKAVELAEQKRVLCVPYYEEEIDGGPTLRRKT